VIERARRAGVDRLIVTGTNEEANERAVELVREHAGLWCTVGVHPHHARHFEPRTSERLRRLAREPGVVAIGECGLDYDRDFSPRPLQRQAFEAQLVLAAELGLPVFLHERRAHADFAAILKAYRDRLTGAVIHCFTGDGVELSAYLDLDLYVGITGWICDERRGAHLLELIGAIPQDRLLLETDAPFLLPRSLKQTPDGRRNEPAYLTEVLATVARATGRSPEEVARASTLAAEKLFGLDPVIRDRSASPLHPRSS
jgi:TatD DNase family protein